MPFRVRITAPRRTRGKQLDARELVRVQAEAVVAYLGESLRNGYVPATGDARPRKANGKPIGFETGTLAKGLRIVDARATRARASIAIEPPNDPGRRVFVAKNPDVITLGGIVDEVRREAVDNYLAKIES